MNIHCTPIKNIKVYYQRNSIELEMFYWYAGKGDNLIYS